MQCMTHIRRARNATALLLVLCACYTRQPLSTSVPAPATRIVARVTDAGEAAIANAVGPGALEIEGVIASANDTVWNLNLLRVTHRGGSTINWNRELVALPRSALSDVRERRLNKSRSWLTAGAVAAGVLIGARVFGNGGVGEDAGGGIIVPTNNRTPGGR